MVLTVAIIIKIRAKLIMISIADYKTYFKEN